MTEAPQNDPNAEDRRKHLDFIQAIITRMSAASSNAKGWLMPIVAATYGYALVNHARSVAVLGGLAVMLFMFLDANYLKQERAYRLLYNAVARKTRGVLDFSLDPNEAVDPADPPQNNWERIQRLMGRWFPAYNIWLSWSIAPFYGALLLAGIVVICLAR